MTNRLINETSPYLLQHAHNPVDWYPWGEEALQRAKKENKPILISIGYSSCHWCHVMEKESFENEETAALMNDHFVSIKIDREERPDLDHIYMDAVQAMTGSGGWPLNVFLTPEARPFYGGTYFPPVRAFNRSSWKEVLLAVSKAFNEKRHEIDAQAENLTSYLLQSNSIERPPKDDTDNIFLPEKIEEAFRNLMRAADKEEGGFGTAPKFPQTFSIQFLLRYHYANDEQDALNQACLSLDKMIDGGIYDQIGGGLARYSTDAEWLVPHFEKMLYDNALFVSVLAEAYQLTRNARYKAVIDETVEFIKRELMNEGCGFYSALDADSDGEEGKFYVWSYQQVQELLNSEAEVFCEFFDITRSGNWPGETSQSPHEPLATRRNILRIKKSIELFAAEKNISRHELERIIKNGKSVLLAERNKRVRPGLDDKIILGWNALMNTACSKAFAATQEHQYRQLAIANMEFLLENFKNKQEKYFHHGWKNNEVKNVAFLDDYAFLIQALLHLQEITGDADWLWEARRITEYVMDHFLEEESNFFFFTDIVQKDVILRKKEVYDGATPSGNATMAYNAYQLSILFDIAAWRKIAENTITSLGNSIIRYPTSFGIWANLLMEMIFGTEEISVVGKNSTSLAEQILGEYFPHKVFMMSSEGDKNLPLLAGKSSNAAPLIYLCRAYSCLKPISTLGELRSLVNDRNKID